ncbi:uncharacterized protein B0I36DRAFT_347867 [Microdochium trichocladiopsis]|uniref:2EXR domain-containing protein n=1 Tax=Microdochium trichocladiopsis TaxID=1682393 RepID=A0A9P8Y8V5_9PEZI|nr:uncharacterized protein B0I36DRAFT_347867 [Microdochium trichocladiopsis]KAH7032686.1 hypothetical protein B0I36DRAFT_347867 [Microdochium trichocladiopsis]
MGITKHRLFSGAPAQTITQASSAFSTPEQEVAHPHEHSPNQFFSAQQALAWSGANTHHHLRRLQCPRPTSAPYSCPEPHQTEAYHEGIREQHPTKSSGEDDCCCILRSPRPSALLGTVFIMAPKTFHSFPHLPPEIRALIYEATIQPRVVHVQERHECKARFMERFRTSVLPPDFEIDDDHVHFAYNWLYNLDIDTPASQKTLDDCGFSVQKKAEEGPKRNRFLGDLTPEIKLNWVMDYQEVAWDLMRKAALFSHAPVPALLHTCKESRGTLQVQGYKLAYATRSAPALTWFNFDIDTLLLKAIDHTCTVPLPDGHDWDVTQFKPADLFRVKQLALSGAQKLLLIDGDDIFPFGFFTDLFECLEELHIIEWLPQNFSEKTSRPPTQNQAECCCHHDPDKPLCLYEELFPDLEDQESSCGGHDKQDTLADEEPSHDYDENHWNHLEPADFHGNGDFDSSRSIYTREAWTIVPQAEEDMYIQSRQHKYHVPWDMELETLSQHEEYLSLMGYPDDDIYEYYEVATRRLQVLLEEMCRWIPEIVVSHVIPDSSTLESLQNLRRLVWKDISLAGGICRCRECRYGLHGRALA